MLLEIKHFYWEKRKDVRFIVYNNDEKDMYANVVLNCLFKDSAYFHYIRLCSKLFYGVSSQQNKPKAIYFSLKCFNDLYEDNIDWLKKDTEKDIWNY